MKKIAAAATCLLMGSSLFSQQDPHFTMYMFNKQVINPGYVGSRPGTYIQGLYRTQWVGLDGAPTTFNLGAHGTVKDKRIALGGYALNDKLGVSQHTGLYGQYAYQAELNGDATLSLGLQAGVTRYHAKLRDLQQPTWAYASGDVLLANDIQSAWLPNLGFGAYLSNEMFYVGASVPHLIDNYYDKDQDLSGVTKAARQYKHYFLMGGIRFDLSDKFALQPQVIAKFVSGTDITVPFDADLDLGMIFNNIIMFGLAYRLDDSFDAYLRAQVTKNLSIGYAYDLTVSELKSYTSGSHEVLIGWEFGERIQKVVGPRLWTF